MYGTAPGELCRGVSKLVEDMVTVILEVEVSE